VGIEVTAIMDHSCGWESLVELDAVLTREWRLHESALRQIEAVGPGNDRWRWSLSPTFSSPAEELFDNGHVDLESPNGFCATVFRSAVRVWHVTDWQSFLTSNEVRSPLRAAVERIGQVVHSQTVIYLPDSTFDCSAATDVLDDGGAFSDVILWLAGNCGPPAGQFGRVPAETVDEWDGYYVYKVATVG